VTVLRRILCIKQESGLKSPVFIQRLSWQVYWITSHISLDPGLKSVERHRDHITAANTTRRSGNSWTIRGSLVAMPVIMVSTLGSWHRSCLCGALFFAFRFFSLCPSAYKYLVTNLARFGWRCLSTRSICNMQMWYYTYPGRLVGIMCLVLTSHRNGW